jgi:hypothetical protein
VAAPDAIDVCGAQRGFNPAALHKSTTQLTGTLKQKMQADGVALAPLVYCHP